jgi:hypothetical protein
VTITATPRANRSKRAQATLVVLPSTATIAGSHRIS